MTIQEALNRVVEGRDLARDEAAEVMRLLMEGEATGAQVGALLAGLRMKGETVEELTGFAQTMRTLAKHVRSHRHPLVDTCGTGGDRSGTFNISTAAAFVVAGAGVAVAKHGNRSASSQCGSADVLEVLGVDIEVEAHYVGQCIDEVGIGFLFARSLHKAMKNVAGPRAEMGTRTVFNLLGPLTNPADADCQVVGVYDRARTKDVAQVLTNLGTQRAFVVAGSDGLDEFTLSGPTYVAESNGGTVTTYELTPGDVHLKEASVDRLQGGDAEKNAQILRDVLNGESGPRRDIVVYNAAAAILAGGGATQWREAVDRAESAIDSGAALDKLNALVDFTRRH